MDRIPIFSWATALGVVLLIPPLWAKEIVVTPAARSNEARIAAAIKEAADGDSIRVTRGLYPERIVIDKRVTIIGEPGTIIDPSEPFKPNWQPAPEIGKGVWRAAVPERPRTLMIGGRILAALDERRAREQGDWHWKRLLASGPPRSGFKFIRALWIHIASDKAVYVHLPDNADPAKFDWSALWARDPAITFRKADGASVSGLTVAHAFTAISFTDKSRRCTVAGCVIGPWDHMGVLITGGASECLVEKNDVFRGAYEDWTPVDSSKERYEVWQIHKKVGFYDRVGIDLIRASVNNRVHANHVHDTFDGINIGDSDVESLDIPLADPDHGRGTEIDENLIERTRDSGMELGVGCIDVRVHHNILRQTHGGLRYKLPRIGPVFIYRNVLEGGIPFNIWYSMDDSPAEGYVYHNTILGGKYALVYSSFNKPHNIGAPKWHYLNNLVVTEKGFFTNWGTGAPVNFTADYNVVVGGGKPWPRDAGDRDKHSRYVDKVELTPDHHPAPDSPAIDAGLDLSTYFHGKPLPGCEPGYFKGKAPDAGAFEVK